MPDDNNPALGLSTAVAIRRLAEIGPNAMPDAKPHWWRRILGKFIAPVPCMLEAAIVLQFAIGETIEAMVIAALLVFNAALGFFQESRAQAALDALKSRLALSASVRRDGGWKNIPAADLVPGDVVKLSLGGVVGADVRLLDGAVLIDQSMLTGESLPVEAGGGDETYAGAMIRRGEATALVTSTGMRTKFGRTAELIRTAHAASSQQRAVLLVVRNLAIFNGTIVVIQVAYAWYLGMTLREIVPLMLTAVLAAIPVALPAMFTLATALGARALGRNGVLPTRLSAVDEAASMSVLCVDKTGTLTRNALAVTAVRPLPGFDAPFVLGLAALASSEAGQDPVDAAIRGAAAGVTATELPALVRFIPFDPANKMSEAIVRGGDGTEMRVVKGAFATVAALGSASAEAQAEFEVLGAQGFRVLAVSIDARIAGLIALSDPPRPESAALIAELREMGVQTVMVTGDAAATAGVVARQVGLNGAVCPAGAVPDVVTPNEFAVFAGILPEDKFHIVKAFQASGDVVGMCGDGANDAPALRQAQMGIAVSTATDVAKSAAGMVLTEPGLGGIVAAVREGRITYQRILTYTLRSVTRKIDQLLFLTVGLAMTGHAILTPMLMVVLMTTGDFLAMSSTTDNVRPSLKPNVWRIDAVTIAGVVMGGFNLLFCSAVLALGAFWLKLDPAVLPTLAAVVLVCSGQAVMYVVRERRHFWHSLPSNWLMASSVIDVAIIGILATQGILMEPLPVAVAAAILGGAVVFAFALDQVKTAIFAALKMVEAD